MFVLNVCCSCLLFLFLLLFCPLNYGFSWHQSTYLFQKRLSSGAKVNMQGKNKSNGSYLISRWKPFPSFSLWANLLDFIEAFLSSFQLNLTLPVLIASLLLFYLLSTTVCYYYYFNLEKTKRRAWKETPRIHFRNEISQVIYDSSLSHPRWFLPYHTSPENFNHGGVFNYCSKENKVLPHSFPSPSLLVSFNSFFLTSAQIRIKACMIIEKTLANNQLFVSEKQSEWFSS